MRRVMTWSQIGSIREASLPRRNPEERKMTWTTLHDKAQQLGFELECHAAAATRHDGAWIRVGSYGEMAELWAHPLNPQAQALARDRVAAMISGCCQHVGTLPDYDEEFQACMAPVLAAMAHPEHGRSPA
jgi:hypothetical protein